jgi:hypothetical protein
LCDFFNEIGFGHFAAAPESSHPGSFTPNGFTQMLQPQ